MENLLVKEVPKKKLNNEKTHKIQFICLVNQNLRIYTLTRNM